MVTDGGRRVGSEPTLRGEEGRDQDDAGDTEGWTRVRRERHPQCGSEPGWLSGPHTGAALDPGREYSTECFSLAAREPVKTDLGKGRACAKA